MAEETLMTEAGRQMEEKTIGISTLCHPQLDRALDLILAPAPLGTDWLALLPSNFEGICHQAEGELKILDEVPDETWVKIDDGNRLRYLRNMIRSARQAFVQMVIEDERAKNPRREKGESPRGQSVLGG